MRMILPVSLLLLASPAVAQTFVIEAPCLPDTVVLPIDNPWVSGDDGTSAIWSYDPVPTSMGTFAGIYVENDGTIGDTVSVFADVGEILLMGPSTTVDSNGVPQTLDLADWSLDARYAGLFGECVLSAASSAVVDGVLTYTFDGSCLPAPIDIPLAGVELDSTDATQMFWSFDPITTPAGTFFGIDVIDDSFVDLLLIESDAGTVVLAGPPTNYASPSLPTSLELADWTFEASYDGASGTCSLTTLTTLSGDELVQTTIGDTPGFEDVLDSGPTNLSSTTIEDRMEALEDAAGSCTTERWAGTWVRGRSPRLQGETEGGAAITGSSITAATVDGSPFSASLATGGRIVGTTDAGSLEGYFARISSRKAIWYAVETSCP